MGVGQKYCAVVGVGRRLPAVWFVDGVGRDLGQATNVHSGPYTALRVYVGVDVLNLVGGVPRRYECDTDYLRALDVMGSYSSDMPVRLRTVA